MSLVTDAMVEARAEHREMVRSTARRNYRRRSFYSGMFYAAVTVALGIAFIPLSAIVYNVLKRGLPYISWSFLTTPEMDPPDIFHPHQIGGISNAIVGTILIDGLALLIAVPISVILAVALFESRGRTMSILRSYVEIMVGLPSILLGVFIYAFFVVPLGFKYCAMAGVLAIAIMMVPLMTVAGEAALRDVPATLSEAALALGARPSRVMWRVVLPFALPRVMTGILLSLGRAVGETAPILFIIGSNYAVNWNPFGQVTAMPTLIYKYQQSSYDYQREACWGIALVLIVAIFTLNVISRFLAARSEKGRK